MKRLNYLLFLGSFLYTTVGFTQDKTSTDSISPVPKPLPGMGLRQQATPIMDILHTCTLRPVLPELGPAETEVEPLAPNTNPVPDSLPAAD